MDQETTTKILEARDILAAISDATNRKAIKDILRRAPIHRRRFIQHLLLLSDLKADWDSDMAQLRDIDAELARLLDDALTNMQESVEAFDFSSRIVSVAYGRYYAGPNRDPVIRLLFRKMRGRTVISDQDLEDTLAIANSVMRSVVDMMRSIMTEQISPAKIAIGNDFADRAEDATNMAHDLSRLHAEYLKAAENPVRAEPSEHLQTKEQESD